MTARTSQFAYVGVASLVGVCLIVFALAAWQSAQMPWGVWGPTLPPELALRWGGLAGDLGRKEPWRLITAAFLHLSVLQLAITLFALKSRGEAIEGRLQWPRVLLLFLISTAAGFGVSRYWYGPFGPVTVGASGGVFGFMGFDLAARLRKRESLVSEPMIQLAITSLLLMLLVPLNNPLHFGGAAFGVLLGLLQKRSAV